MTNDRFGNTNQPYLLIGVEPYRNPEDRRLSMPKFFFSVEGEEPDAIGVELPDLRSARGQAVQAAGEILRDIDGEFTGGTWIMRVHDEAGKRVLELRFTLNEER